MADQKNKGSSGSTSSQTDKSSQSDGMSETPSPTYVSDFLATSDGLALTKAFMEIKEPKLRRRIVDLVEEIAGREG